MDEMCLSIIKRKEEVCLSRKLPWQNISVRVSCIVIVCLMVTYTWHKGSIGSKFLSQFSE